MYQMSPEEIRFLLLDLDSKTVIQEPPLVCVHLRESVTSPAFGGTQRPTECLSQRMSPSLSRRCSSKAWLIRYVRRESNSSRRRLPPLLSGVERLRFEVDDRQEVYEAANHGVGVSG